MHVHMIFISSVVAVIGGLCILGVLKLSMHEGRITDVSVRP